MIRERRPSPQTKNVLAALAERADGMYGYELSKMTGLPSGTVYPILMRLADRGLLAAEWTENTDGKPPRHVYRLTHKGKDYARAAASGQAHVRLSTHPESV